jgi:hypothetical protein
MPWPRGQGVFAFDQIAATCTALESLTFLALPTNVEPLGPPRRAKRAVACLTYLFQPVEALMRMTRVLSALLLFSAFSLYSSASGQPTRTPSVQSWQFGATGLEENSYFGWTTAISGNTVVVGVGDAGGTQRAYVYEKPASGWSNMLPTAELSASDDGTDFGVAVAISGDTIVVGSYGGKAYIFVKPPGGWTSMTETAQVTGDYFGGTVAIDGGTIIVGAAGATINGEAVQGAAFVFVKPAGGWATSSAFDAELTASDGTYGDYFGYSLGVSGNTVAVGQPAHQYQTGPGAAYVFVEPSTGWANMTQTAELTPSVSGPYDEFGAAVAIRGNTIVAGSPQANNDEGGAYVFVEPATGWANATETALLTAPGSAVDLGFSVGISGKDIAASALDNLVYVYAEPATGWQSTSTAAATLTGGQRNSDFGYSMAIGSGVVVAGAIFQTVDGNTYQGAAFGFELTPP